MLIDALILAGGKSSRLGHAPKSELVYQDKTLLELTLEAVSFAAKIAVVGPAPLRPLPAGVMLTIEKPRFGGPVAAVSAGMKALQPGSDYTMLLACDMPAVATATSALLAALPLRDAAAGIICVDETGRTQPLAAVYATGALSASLRSMPKLAGMAMNDLIAGLNLSVLRSPSGATDDVDDWADARRFGIEEPPPPQ